MSDRREFHDLAAKQGNELPPLVLQLNFGTVSIWNFGTVSNWNFGTVSMTVHRTLHASCAGAAKR